MQSVKANHVDLIDQIAVVVIAHRAAQHVHLSARGEQNCTTEVMMIEFLFHVSEAVKNLSSALVVANIHNLVGMENVGVFNILLDSVFN